MTSAEIKDKVTNYMSYSVGILSAIYGIISIFGINVGEDMKEVIIIAVEVVITLAVIVIGFFTGKKTIDDTMKINE